MRKTWHAYLTINGQHQSPCLWKELFWCNLFVSSWCLLSNLRGTYEQHIKKKEYHQVIGWESWSLVLYRIQCLTFQIDTKSGPYYGASSLTNNYHNFSLCYGASSPTDVITYLLQEPITLHTFGDNISKRKINTC